MSDLPAQDAPPPAPPPVVWDPAEAPPERRRLVGLGRLPMTIVALTVVSVLTNLSATAFLLSSRDEAADFVAGRTTEAEFEDALRPAGTLGLLQFVTLWATAITTMIWLFRILRNHRALGRTGTWAPGWAFGAWFVPPGVLYVVPYLVLREAWRASSPGDDAGWRREHVPAVITVWWVLFGLAPLALLAAGGPAVVPGVGGDTTADLAASVRDDAAANVASFVATAVAGIAWIVIVRSLSARHRALVAWSGGR